jgi:hypothetical protein
MDMEEQQEISHRASTNIILRRMEGCVPYLVSLGPDLEGGKIFEYPRSKWGTLIPNDIFCIEMKF